MPNKCQAGARRPGQGCALLIAAAVLVLGAWPAGARAEAPVPDAVPVRVTDSRPRLIATTEELHALRRRIATDPWAAEVAAAVLAEADALVAEALDIPRTEGQWSHWYVGEAGNRLEPRSPAEHVDPKTGTVYTGDPYDAAYAAMRHGHWLRGVQTLGMAYALGEAPRHAARVRAILLEYADFYTDLRKHSKHKDRSFTGARLFAQTLDEAVAACHIVAGYDLVYNAPCFSPEDHAVIERDLLRPMVRVIRCNNRGMSNWQAWHNAAVGSIGFLLGDRRLVDVAVNGRHGLLYHLRRSTYGSGLWYELAPIYHWYALNACTYLFEAARRSGMDLYAIPRVRRMFAAPVRFVLPDGTFAPMHDSDRLALSDDRWFLDVAHARYGDPFFAAAAGPRPTGEAIVHRSETLPESRSLGLEAAAFALFWGAEEWPDVPLVLRSSNDRHEGLAVLRAGTARSPKHDVAVLFDYGLDLAGHVHPAKLGVVLYAGGDIRLVDPGRAPYAHPLQHGWYRRTIAHNTVVVDERDQRPARGWLRAWAAREDWALARATCEDAYPGVTLNRTVLLAGTMLVDVFLCRGENDKVYDLPMHLRGGLQGLPDSAEAPPLSHAPGYDALWDWARFEEPVTHLQLGTADGAITVRMLDTSESWHALGHGPLATGEAIPMLLRRQEGATAWFVTLYGLAGEDLGAFSAEPGGPREMTVTGEGIRLELTGNETRLRIGERTWTINQAGAR